VGVGRGVGSWGIGLPATLALERLDALSASADFLFFSDSSPPVFFFDDLKSLMLRFAVGEISAYALVKILERRVDSPGIWLDGTRRRNKQR